MKKLRLFALAIFILVLAVVFIDNLSTYSLATRARNLRVGDSKHHVEQILGRPMGWFQPPPQTPTNLIAALLSVRAETWAYGSRLELRQPFISEFPYFFPFRIRLFRPDSDDVVVEFDSGGRVSKLIIP